MGVSKPDDAEGTSADDAEGTSADDAEKETVDISGTTAPSIGPNTVIEKKPPQERLAGHDQSSLDAMGLEKRRQVVGGSYSASVTRQIVTYAIVVAVVIGAGFGLKKLADNLDQPPAHAQDQAPWTGSDKKAKPLQ
jgi:hypothetical protein